MSAMQPLQSMVGMFANPGALGMGGAAPGASAASAAGGISAAATEVGAGGGGAALGGGGMPATSFTRPVSAFESGTSGRPVGLRPSGALGADVVRAPTTTVGGTLSEACRSDMRRGSPRIPWQVRAGRDGACCR